MRKLVFTLAVLALHPSLALALPQSITLAADSWCPYNCEPTSEKPGYSIEIAKAIYEPKGIHVNYEVVPWTRALRGTQSGKYTAAIGATRAEAPKLIFPKEPIGTSAYHFYTTAESKWKHTTIPALTGIVLGVVDGYSYGEEMDRFIAKHKNHREHLQIVGGDTATMQNIKKLLAGRIDVMLEDPNVVSNTLISMGKQNHLQDAGAINKRSIEDNLYLAFSPNTPDSKKLALILDEGIRILRKTGQLEKILHRYGLKDWK